MKKLQFILFLFIALVVVIAVIIGPFCNSNSNRDKRDSFGIVYARKTQVSLEEEEVFNEEFTTHGNYLTIKYLNQNEAETEISIIEKLVSSGIDHIFFNPTLDQSLVPFEFAKKASLTRIYGYKEPLQSQQAIYSIVPDYRVIAERINSQSGFQARNGMLAIFHRNTPLYIQLALRELHHKGYSIETRIILSETGTQIKFEMEKLIQENYSGLIAGAELINHVDYNLLPDKPLFILEINQKNRLPLLQSVTIPCGGSAFAERVADYIPDIENSRSLPLTEVDLDGLQYQLLLIDPFQ